MTSQIVKGAFLEAGIKVRVKSFPQSFRICTVDKSAHSAVESGKVLVALGFGKYWYINSKYEIFATKVL